MKAEVKTWNAPMIPMTRLKKITGESSGSVTARNWLRVHEAGVGSYVVLAATHERALEVVPLEVLEQYAVDVPADPGSIGG